MTELKDLPPLALDRFADSADYAIVGPTDGRTRVLNTRRAPYAAICHIERDFGDGRFSGCTGFLISPLVILTAAHCVFSRPRQAILGRGSPTRIRITPGRDGATHPFGFQWASRWYAHRNFVERGNASFDFGIIMVLRPFARAPAPLTISAKSDPQLQTVRARRLLHIAGFPGDKPRGTMWEHSERLDRVAPLVLHYSIDTCPGHSGSPVWVKRQRTGPVNAIAVHTAGPRPHAQGAWGCRPGVPVAPAGAVNRGVRLTRALVDIAEQARRGTVHPSMRRLQAKP